MVEPAGIFQGRGKHPKRGMWKKQVSPEDITINCTSNFPSAPNGHKWNKVISNTNGLYTCFWFENIMNCRKSVMFARTSSPIQEKEKQKFDKALKLTQNWDKVQNHINKGLESHDRKVREIATVSKLIMDLGIRVGDEKGEDTADTVGASSLRKEHISIDGNNVLTLNFLGKDSIRYKNSVKVEPILISNIKEFMKNNSEKLFPNVNSVVVKSYLNEVIDNISAKTFRTSKSSSLMSKLLKTYLLPDSEI
jgi:DNA topoisomerase-1